MKKFPLAAVLSLALLVARSPSINAHTFTGPTSCVADTTGFFSYSCTLAIGPGSLLLAGGGGWAISNVFGVPLYDCFCDPEFCFLAEGDTQLVPIVGWLIDPLTSGEVENWVAPCYASTYELNTVILPHRTVGIGDQGDADGRFPILLQNAPNPFGTGTDIRFWLAQASEAGLLVFDLRGRIVRSLMEETQLPSGWHEVHWNGTGNDGRAVANGIYLYLLKADGHHTARRLSLIR